MNETKTILVTGSSSGLGLAIANFFLKKNQTVFGLARRETPLESPLFKGLSVDLTQYGQVEELFRNQLSSIKELDTLYLNAGDLGPIESLRGISGQQLKETFEINFFSQFFFMQQIFKNSISVKSVVAISSGAARKGSPGWGAYNTSKAAFLMMISVLAKENPETHFLSLAPGLVDSEMQKKVRAGNVSQFPNLQRFFDAYETKTLTPASAVIEKFWENREFFQQLDSGSFYDLRDLKSN